MDALRISPVWTARVEYLFIDVSPTLTAAVPAFIGGGTVTANSTIKDNVVRVGVNFKFTAF
jgi:opacity protein-like surface antigen